MRSPVSDLKSPALVAAAMFLAGCGDETTGPQFGDLEFTQASPVVIGSARQVDLVLRNESDGSLGPVVIGAGNIPLSVPRGFTCTGLEIVITPNQIQSMVAGRSVEVGISFSFAGLNEEQCPLATYEVDINAALSSTVLASTQVRLDHLEIE